ncbi:hypothetical protein, partial [Salmonella sp. SAL4458]|uniref:hypothetical protein n=1 Tax=Salmonella sp. SAL4458 TaxID=3159913 RepID=UPI0039793F9C
DFDSYLNVQKGRVHRYRQLAVLQASFNDAVQKWGWLDYNVLKEVKKRKSAARTRYVTDDEVESLKKFMSPTLCAAIDIALLTGRQQSDVI